MATSQFDINQNFSPYDFSGNNKEFADYLGRYRSAISGQQRVPDIYTGFGDKLGVPQLEEQARQYREQLSGLQSQLAAVPDTVAGTTRNSLVTDSQRQRIVQAQSEPLNKTISQVAPAASMAEQALGSAREQAGNLTGMEMAQQEKDLLPFEAEYDYLTRRTAMQASGYSDAMRMELDKLIANQRAGLEWTNAERDRANALAIAESGYKNALEQIRERGNQDRLTNNDQYGYFGTLNSYGIL